MAKVSAKQIQIDKANATMVAFIAITAFISVFSLVVSKSLLSQRSYQSKVSGEKQKALTQLKANNVAAQQLASSYQAFVSPSDNIIGGNTAGTGNRDGDNAKIVLDALPSKYDFPALTTSLEKIITSKNYKINSITGTDDEVNQSQPNQVSQPVSIPFQISFDANTDGLSDVLTTFENSIRPIKLNKLNVTGKDSDLTIAITATTYYQPEKIVKITTKVVK